MKENKATKKKRQAAKFYRCENGKQTQWQTSEGGQGQTGDAAAAAATATVAAATVTTATAAAATGVTEQQQK